MSTTIDFGDGETYTQFADVWERLATFSPLGDDYILRQVANVAATTNMDAPSTVDANGYDITITSDSYGDGDIDSGNTATSTANTMLYPKISGTGNVIIEKLNLIGGSGSSIALLPNPSVNVSGITYTVKDCVFRDFQIGITTSTFNAPYYYLYNLKFFTTSVTEWMQNALNIAGLLANFDANLYTDHRVMENITIRSPYTGANSTTGVLFSGAKISGVGNEWVMKNVVSAHHTAYNKYSYRFTGAQDTDHDIDNCAASDTTLSYGTNVHNSIVPGSEFKSATPTENNYCVPTGLQATAAHTRTPATGFPGQSIPYTDTTVWSDGSLVLGQGGDTPTYATNDMAGNARTGIAIGAHEAPLGTYSWDFGDGSTVSTATDPTHAYPNPGLYTTTQTVSAGNGITTATSTVTIYRSNEPIYKYRTSEIRMGGVHAPVFPVQRGETTHTNVTNKRIYTNTTRFHPTTSVSWKSQNVKSADRDDIYDFWNTTLSKGYNDFTLIDNRGRMLFESSWNNYREQWKKQRGGIFDIDYLFQSAIGWSPVCFGAYFMTDNTLDTHILNNFDLSLDDGTLVNYAGDTDILRKNGYALKLVDGAGTETGASGNTAWRKTKNNTSMSIFCQARTIGVADKLYLVKLTDGTNVFSIILDDDDGSNDYLKGEITTGATTGIVYKADTSSPSLPDDTWYDVCLTYEAVNDKWFLYYDTSETGTSYTKFLDGATSLEDNILSTISESIGAADTTWSSLTLLEEAAAGTLNSKTGYLQNVMIFDDYIPPMQFNTLRRLCHLWNNKSTGTWPA